MMIQTAIRAHEMRRHIAQLLHDVADPEIPVVSIVDLGMVIDIYEKGGVWLVDLAPTYSGCPAIDVIPMLVSARLKEADLEDVVVKMNISPPWSTDWISDAGKAKLAAYGIAPPEGKASKSSGEDKPKKCPQCGSTHTTMISRYSSTPCKAAYRCEECREPFEYFKCY